MIIAKIILKFFSNLPTSAAFASDLERSVATEGFSAMIKVFDIRA